MLINNCYLVTYTHTHTFDSDSVSLAVLPQILVYLHYRFFSMSASIIIVKLDTICIVPLEYLYCNYWYQRITIISSIDYNSKYISRRSNNAKTSFYFVSYAKSVHFVVAPTFTYRKFTSNCIKANQISVV